MIDSDDCIAVMGNTRHRVDTQKKECIKIDSKKLLLGIEIVMFSLAICVHIKNFGINPLSIMINTTYWIYTMEVKR